MPYVLEHIIIYEKPGMVYLCASGHADLHMKCDDCSTVLVVFFVNHHNAQNAKTNND